MILPPDGVVTANWVMSSSQTLTPWVRALLIGKFSDLKDKKRKAQAQSLTLCRIILYFA